MDKFKHAIIAEKLTKCFGSHLALDDLNLRIDDGEIFGFLGPNGAGKTTFIRILLDLIRPTTGSISVFGLCPLESSIEIRSRCGYLPGELRLDENITVRAIINYFVNLRGGSSKIKNNAYILSERLSLDLDPKIKNLSKGNKQKIGIILAFMHSPDLLLLDEPTSGLDPLTQKSVLEIVNEAKDEGSTVFMSSHIFSEIRIVTDRFAIVRGGSVIDVRKTSDLEIHKTTIVKVKFNGAIPHRDTLKMLQNVSLKYVSSISKTLNFEVNGSMDQFLKFLSGYDVERLETSSDVIEDLFFSYYDTKK